MTALTTHIKRASDAAQAARRSATIAKSAADNVRIHAERALAHKRANEDAGMVQVISRIRGYLKYIEREAEIAAAAADAAEGLLLEMRPNMAVETAEWYADVILDDATTAKHAEESALWHVKRATLYVLLADYLRTSIARQGVRPKSSSKPATKSVSTAVASPLCLLRGGKH